VPLLALVALVRASSWVEGDDGRSCSPSSPILSEWQRPRLNQRSETEVASGVLRPEGVSDEASLAFGWATVAKDVDCAKAACKAIA
jgi:hypothetical protein